MADTTFDLPQLAKYLHLPENQVKKLADRGDLPGRKIKGDWQFAHAEIHHWLEQRIGLSDDRTLASMEDALEKAAPADGQKNIPIAKIIPREAIAVPFPVRTKESAIRSMVQLAANTGYLWDTEKMIEALRKREELHPTALGNGVALLHPRRPMGSILGESFIALGIAPNGVYFGDTGGLTDIFFLICSTDDQMHLRILARLSRIITAEGFLTSLRSLESSDEILALIADTEAEIYPKAEGKP
ncbi:MAG: PTS sugar transporter subunit IIA [Planctomycetaceae bacterium]|jgi:PTS system nitrogen regulatory IIA component|nr:PTS sugar transporter subunit IIA [Planctomycetaceae bacterium]